MSVINMFNFSNFVKYPKYLRFFCTNIWRPYSLTRGIKYSNNVQGIHTSCISSLTRISDNFSFQSSYRHIKTSSLRFSEEVSEVTEVSSSETKAPIDPSKDRTKIIPPETSIRYMKSEAYKTTYGDEPVWVKYRRNFKGQFIPKRTRKTCIRGGVIATGSPCPICRDEYLVLHYTNVDLLKQFICPQTGEIYDLRKIHLCQKKLLQLEVAITKAKFYGYLTYDVPFRKYDYSEYYPAWKE